MTSSSADEPLRSPQAAEEVHRALKYPSWVNKKGEVARKAFFRRPLKEEMPEAPWDHDGLSIVQIGHWPQIAREQQALLDAVTRLTHTTGYVTLVVSDIRHIRCKDLPLDVVCDPAVSEWGCHGNIVNVPFNNAFDEAEAYRVATELRDAAAKPVVF